MCFFHHHPDMKRKMPAANQPETPADVIRNSTSPLVKAQEVMFRSTVKVKLAVLIFEQHSQRVLTPRASQVCGRS